MRGLAPNALLNFLTVISAVTATAPNLMLLSDVLHCTVSVVAIDAQTAMEMPTFPSLVQAGMMCK